MNAAIERLRTNAHRCRDLASTSVTNEARLILSDLADDFDRQLLDEERNGQRKRVFVWPL